MPLYYADDALRAVMIRGAAIGEIGLDLAMLAGCSLVFVLANVRALRKFRRL